MLQMQMLKRVYDVLVGDVCYNTDVDMSVFSEIE